jgi:ribosomal protein S18 acetylase RimI-like enzyme
MTLRTILKVSDPDTIFQIVQNTGFFRPEECQIARELAEESLAKPGEYEFIFAETDGCTIGYICYAEIPGTVGSYELYWMAVEPAQQGAGIGKALTIAAEEDIKARGGRQIYISTSGSELYSKTRAFYDRMGYEKAATLKDFFLPGDDEIIYVKRV